MLSREPPEPSFEQSFFEDAGAMVSRRRRLSQCRNSAMSEVRVSELGLSLNLSAVQVNCLRARKPCLRNIQPGKQGFRTTPGANKPGIPATVRSRDLPQAAASGTRVNQPYGFSCWIRIEQRRDFNWRFAVIHKNGFWSND